MAHMPTQATLSIIGWWCPRCDCEAYPTSFSIGAGWCPICGMDPLVKPFATLVGIRGLVVE